METCFNYCDKDTAYFSSDERKWITKIHKLKDQHPDEVTIIREPENNDGCIYCKLPPSYLKLKPKRVLSEEQLAAATERMNAARAKLQSADTQNVDSDSYDLDESVLKDDEE